MIKQIKENIETTLDKPLSIFKGLIRIPKKIKKIIDYIPVLWKDEDWDYEYLLNLMSFKLERMKHCLWTNDIITKEELSKIVTSINKTLYHIHNYQEADEAFELIKYKLPFEVEISSKPSESHGGFSQLITTNVSTGKELTEEEDKIYDKYLEDKVIFEQQEWNNIFDTIKKHGQKWWD